MIEFGDVKKVDIREIWKNEAYDFTPWLSENLDKLGEVLGMELEFIENEANVGEYSLDILAKDASNNKYVIIENQYGTTDHKHLGQLLTYGAGYNASTIIWISEEIRDEHREVIDWLNQITDENTSFYGVIIEVIKIDNSRPAFNFKLVAFPNEWSKETKSNTTANSSKMESYRRFFQELLDTLRIDYKYTSAKKGQAQSWYNFSMGKGLSTGISFALGNKVRSEIYIDTGDKVKNKEIFDKLYAIKDDIENKIKNKLEWERMDDKQGSRIALYRNGNIQETKEILEEIKKWGIDNLLKFKELLKKDDTVKNIINK